MKKPRTIIRSTQIAALKAFGYGNLAIGWHFIKMILAIVFVGIVIGVIEDMRHWGLEREDDGGGIVPDSDHAPNDGGSDAGDGSSDAGDGSSEGKTGFER